MDNQTLNIRPKGGHGLIYCYISPSGKRFIGRCNTALKDRAKKNAKGYKGCKYFYQAIQKYGWQNFQVEILDEVPHDQTEIVEYWYCKKFNTFDREFGYNIPSKEQELLLFMDRIPIYGYDRLSGKFCCAYPNLSAAEQTEKAYPGSIKRVLNLPHRYSVGKIWLTERFDQIDTPDGSSTTTSQEGRLE